MTRLATALLGAMIAAAVAATPAAAGWPGQNGLIAFERLTSQAAPRFECGSTSIDCAFVQQVWTVRESGRRRRELRACAIRDTRFDPKLTRNCDLGKPAWAPNGRRLALVSRGDTQFPAVNTVNTRGGDHEHLTEALAPGAPAWSPDGRSVVFAVETERDGTPDPQDPGDGGSGTRAHPGLYIASLVTDTVRRLTANPIDANPAWSSRGTIAFDRGDPYDPEAVNLFTVRPDGRGLRRVTRRGGERPNWSPNGRRLAFHRTRNGAEDLYTVRADGRGVRRLTRNGDSSDPAWSPDGRRLVFVWQDGIATIGTDGKRRRWVARSRGTESLLAPDWQPLPKRGR